MHFIIIFIDQSGAQLNRAYNYSSNTIFLKIIIIQSVSQKKKYHSKDLFFQELHVFYFWRPKLRLP